MHGVSAECLEEWRALRSRSGGVKPPSVPPAWWIQQCMESKRFRTAHQWYVAGNPGYGTSTRQLTPAEKCEAARRHARREDAHPSWAADAEDYCLQVLANKMEPRVLSAGVPPQKTKWPIILALLAVGGFLFFAGPVGALRMRPLG